MSRVEYDYCHVPTRPPESISSAIARVSVSEVLLLLLLQMFLLFLLFAAVQELAHQIDPLS